MYGIVNARHVHPIVHLLKPLLRVGWDFKSNAAGVSLDILEFAFGNAVAFCNFLTAQTLHRETAHRQPPSIRFLMWLLAVAEPWLNRPSRSDILMAQEVWGMK